MRLIDADALKGEIVEAGQRNSRHKYKIGEPWELDCEEIWQTIDKMPTMMLGSNEEKKMKSILVIETPESCEECPLKRYSNLQLVCTPMNKDVEDVECPLRPLPARKAKTLTQCESAGEWLRCCGYDECLDDVLGEDDE